MELNVGVKAVLRNEEGRVLLLRRNTETYGDTDGVWDIVGGRIKAGTALLENLEREIFEETGLSMTRAPKLIAAQDLIRDERHTVRLTYVAETRGKPQLDTSENEEYRWLDFSELSGMPGLDRYVRELLDTGTLTYTSWD